MPRISAQRLAALLLTASLGAACSRSKPEPPPVIDPASRRVAPAGDVVGFVGQYDSHVWRGIPYAQPPVGDLRCRDLHLVELGENLRANGVLQRHSLGTVVWIVHLVSIWV